MMDHHWDSTEQVFHDAIREYLIDLLFFAILYLSSYVVICHYKRQADKEDYFSADASDAIVYRVALWSCTFTLAISVGAGVLLPFSILSNEVLVFYPNNFYMKWLNGSLIHGLWNLIFLFSNLALFVLMPFAYFLTESEGFAGSKKGIKARVYETFVVLLILGLLVFGMVWVASAILDNDSSSRETLGRVWSSYLPYLYTCISLLGVAMLLISTPLGFTRMFSVIGELVVKPQFMENLDEEYHLAKFEEDDLLRKIKESSATYTIEQPNGQTDLRQRLADVQRDRRVLDRRRRASSWQRNLGYPLLWILLFALTVLSLCMVGWNIFRLLFGIGFFSVSIKEAGLGKVSLSMLGSFGALIEVALICYLMLASVVGFYSVPFFRTLVPRTKDTPMTKVIANCLVLLVLSSALPLLSRTLGITNYDLIGEFGRSNWLQNFYLIIIYNILFSILTSSCLLNKFTATVRDYILQSVTLYMHNVREANQVRTSKFWAMRSWKTQHANGTNGKVTGVTANGASPSTSKNE
ncbi:protein LMBR1L-like [Asterias amurensis]|uniref:protein LMBR1L-like n=1 Tax=Asterias amurensis TaxID=7602 RepID=UPI003AB1D4FF